MAAGRQAWGALVLAAALGACPQTSPTTPGACTDARCEAVACCGDACDGGGCCAGTVCSQAGRCVPVSCARCPGGCTYDAKTCSAECTPPVCCLQRCTQDTDCCPGTLCGSASDGGRQCFPSGCDACRGMTPLCRTNSTCGLTCEPPLACGRSCTTSGDCDTLTTCQALADGARRCVPLALGALCRGCPFGCAFDPDTCRGRCLPADGGAAAFCLSCCEACALDGGLTACCSGHSCQPTADGGGQCLPNECNRCGGGCRATCPGG